jgi:hypothetical protein
MTLLPAMEALVRRSSLALTTPAPVVDELYLQLLPVIWPIIKLLAGITSIFFGLKCLSALLKTNSHLTTNEKEPL